MNSHKVDKIGESRTLSFLCENRYKLNVLLKWLPTHGTVKTLRISSDNKTGFCEYNRQDSADNAVKYAKNDLRCNGIFVSKGLKYYREPMAPRSPSKSNVKQPDKQENIKLKTKTMENQQIKKQSEKRKRDEAPNLQIKKKKTVNKKSSHCKLVKQEIKPEIEKPIIQPQPETAQFEYITYNDSTDDEEPIFDLNIAPEEQKLCKEENAVLTTDTENDLYVIKDVILKEFKPGDEITIAKVLELVNGPKYRGKMIRNWSTKKPFDEDEISKISVRQSLNRNNTVFKYNPKTRSYSIIANEKKKKKRFTVAYDDDDDNQQENYFNSQMENLQRKRLPNQLSRVVMYKLFLNSAENALSKVLKE